MYKMIIADDEAIIRRGIKNSLNWKELGIEIVADAEDGQKAFELSKMLMPDLVLIDICMPMLDGLELIKKLKAINPNILIVIISGHDEFEYAKEAVRLNVIDYILKPVDEDELLVTIEKVIQILNDRANKSHVEKLHQKVMEENIDEIQYNFLEKIIKEDYPYTLQELEFHRLDILKEQYSMIVAKPTLQVNVYEKNYDFSMELLIFSVMNILNELISEFKVDSKVFRFYGDYIIGLVNIKEKEVLDEVTQRLENQITLLLHHDCYIKAALCMNGNKSVKSDYDDLLHKIESDMNYTPVVFRVKSYIERNYGTYDLCLEDVADSVKMNPTYLSRLLKSEIGNTFIDYLTKVRIDKAIELMHYDDLKIYEIGDMIGYKSQHYFSKAFKRVKGISPKNYQDKIKKEVRS